MPIYDFRDLNRWSYLDRKTKNWLEIVYEGKSDDMERPAVEFTYKCFARQPLDIWWQPYPTSGSGWAYSASAPKFLVSTGIGLHEIQLSTKHPGRIIHEMGRSFATGEENLGVQYWLAAETQQVDEDVEATFTNIDPAPEDPNAAAMRQVLHLLQLNQAERDAALAANAALIAERDRLTAAGQPTNPDNPPITTDPIDPAAP